jgi:hypothetical protein
MSMPNSGFSTVLEVLGTCFHRFCAVIFHLEYAVKP